jgi:crossover junction endodeoxyribonuclease RuvC
MKKDEPRERCVLGLDPGLATLGYAVVTDSGGKFSLVVCSVITTRPDTPLPLRLQAIYQALGEIIGQYQPREAALEEFLFLRNARTSLNVGMARGIALLALQNAGLPIAVYEPSVVKQAVAGKGNAGKWQVGEGVRVALALPSIPRPDDAADAAAIALCHLTRCASAC